MKRLIVLLSLSLALLAGSAGATNYDGGVYGGGNQYVFCNAGHSGFLGVGPGGISVICRGAANQYSSIARYSTQSGYLWGCPTNAFCWAWRVYP